ncbi:MAG: carbon storage regulator [Bryobacterales bacterium]|nr:carbon storage regulator [Bryobacterales bacterium]
MLITRRKVGEALLIGDAIEVVVLEVNQGRVKLGVSAPPDVAVERKEWRLVLDQNRSASGSTVSAFVQGILGAGVQFHSGRPGATGTGFRLSPRTESPIEPGISSLPGTSGG